MGHHHDDCCLHRLVDEIIKKHDLSVEILQQLKKMEATNMGAKEDLEAGIAAVDQKVTDVADKLTDFASDFAAAVQSLKDQIAAGGTGPDLTPSIQALSTLSDKASAIATSLSDLDVQAEAISGKPTPPPVV